MAKKSKQKKENNRAARATGIILFGLGIALFLAIVSFSRLDNPHLNIENNSISIKNWLGPVGAAVSEPLMKFTLGYPILILPALLIIFGVQVYRQKPVIEKVGISVFLVLWAILFSVYLAVPESFQTNGHIEEYYPSGMIGGEAAAFMVLYLGKFGTGLALVIITLALLVLTVQIEFSFLLDWFKKFFNNLVVSWQEAARKKNEQKKLTKFSKPEIPEEMPARPLEIKTEEPEAEKIAEPDEIEEETPPARPIDLSQPEKPARIKTTLDEIMELTGKEEPKKTPAPKAEKSEPVAEVSEEPDNGEMDFEVEEEAKVEEVDYDQLVKESIAKYQFPSIDLLDSKIISDAGVSKDELRLNAELLEQKLLDFGLKAKVIRVTAGPVITLYELQPAPGVKVSSIVALANDLALAMEARGIRMVAPIPGKAAIGIEIPNRNPQVVYLKSLIRSETFAESNYILPLALGKTINGEVYCADLAKMPHLLIAGSTGSGKSVGINTIITSLMYRKDPGKVKFVLIDPKKIELSLYRDLRDHFLIWRTDIEEEVITKPKNAVSILNSIVLEMEKRYDKLAGLGVRGIEEYNKKVQEGGTRVKKEKLQQIPYIIVIVDELADLMMVAAKEVEAPIARLAQMARAVGIHLILATQRPSVDVLTGVIKANFPARIAFMVTTRPDSKTILDTNGAEQLLGNGDMLFQPPGEPRAIRLQNPFISTEEVTRIIKHVRKQPKLPHYSLPQPSGGSASAFDINGGDSDDELYDQAKQIVIQHQQGSISLLQRRLKIGYARAARLIDMMEEDGIVGPSDGGGKPRQVLYQGDDF